MPGVVLHEDGVTREVFAHDVYRIRVKRHHILGEVSTYPTQAALEFLGQPSGQLPGMEEVHLIAGYEWDRDELRIVHPVLSLRDGPGNILWLVEPSGIRRRHDGRRRHATCRGAGCSGHRRLADARIPRRGGGR